MDPMEIPSLLAPQTRLEDAHSFTTTLKQSALRDRTDTMTLPPPSPGLYHSYRPEALNVETKCTSFKLTDEQMKT